MLAINPAGIAACLTPGTRGTNGTYVCNIYLMNGEMPLPEFLEEIQSEAEMVATFTDIAYKFDSLSIQTTYYWGINERTFKKTPVDALPFTPLAAGSIGWAAIVFPGEKIMYTDSVGLWDDTDSCITVSTKDVTTDTEAILKDINLVVRDKSTYELYPNGIFA